MSTRVAVVGGGVSGLTAAYRLRTLLGPDAEIVLLEQHKMLGGKLRTIDLAGARFDVGAEAFLARRPEVLDLATELGISDQVVHPGTASSRIRAGGSSGRVPARTVMGVPASATDVEGVLSERGVQAVRAEADLPPLSLDGADVAVGDLLRDRLGAEVVDRLVEPLLGGVYAGSADSLGLRATIPALAAALDAGASSVTEAVRRSLPEPVPETGVRPPVFGAFRGGYRQLLDQLLLAANADLRLGAPVRALQRTGDGWSLSFGSSPEPEQCDVDGVVLAVPAPAAARLLSDAAEGAAQHLGGVELASMAVVALAFPAEAQLPELSGTLIARGERHEDSTPFTAKAFTLSGTKWPHLRGENGEQLVRGSVGRFGEAGELRLDDDELLDRVCADLAELTGVDTDPVDAAVVRWGGGLPQYGVGHLDSVAEVERDVDELPGLAVAGAALHGVGVPACVATATAAAESVSRDLLAS